LIDIYRNKPPRKKYKEIHGYQNEVYRKKYNLDMVDKFFKIFPEEKRGRKNFKKKEIQNTKALVYESIFQKAIKIRADCIGSIKEEVSKDTIMITVSFFRKYG
jgi:hypothetical protein